MWCWLEENPIFCRVKQSEAADKAYRVIRLGAQVIADLTLDPVVNRTNFLVIGLLKASAAVWYWC